MLFFLFIMSENSHRSVELKINEVLGDRIKRKLHNVVEKRMNSRDFRLCVEPASKKGESIKNKCIEEEY